MKSKPIKDQVLEIICIRLTYDGSFQRTHIYKPGVADSKRNEFRLYMAAQLPKLLLEIQAKEKYTDANHYTTISRFSRKVSLKYGAILKNGIFRIGNAQKFINLYWKVCWLLKPGISKPIHCPFDSIILAKLGRKAATASWTKLNDIAGYKKWVTVTKEKAGVGNSIAEWELAEYIKKVNYDIL